LLQGYIGEDIMASRKRNVRSCQFFVESYRKRVFCPCVTVLVDTLLLPRRRAVLVQDSASKDIMVSRKISILKLFL
jgi:hypothetical protein